jgi:hypothetical protein
MESIEETRALWEAHCAAEFPRGCAGASVSGYDLVSLDADVAGCVDTFLRHAGQLDVQSTAILGRGYRAVTLAARELSSDEAQRYFRRLEALAGTVLSALSIGETAR